jgi:hypothetical protein
MKKSIRTSCLYGGLWIVMGLFLITACATLSGDAKKPTVSVTGTGLPKAAMLIKGSGFKAGEEVELELDMGGLPIIFGRVKGKPVTASDDGTFESKSSLPAKQIMVPGTWVLRATGNKGSKAECEVVMKLK